ncbi:MAG: hypothetical protein ACXVBH_07320, partial [Flavisolibacter sp.]
DHDATEQNSLVKDDFDAGTSLSSKNNEVILEISLDKNWLLQKRRLVTTSTLTKAIVPGLPFENVDGSAISIDKDYNDRKRNVVNPSPGPFEILKTGRQTIKVWQMN